MSFETSELAFHRRGDLLFAMDRFRDSAVDRIYERQKRAFRSIGCKLGASHVETLRHHDSAVDVDAVNLKHRLRQIKTDERQHFPI